MSLRACAVAIFAAATACSGASSETSGGTTGSATGSGTTTSGGTTGSSSGASGSGIGDGGCSTEVRGTELLLCHSNLGCACPQTCVQDPGIGEQVCELSCTTTADCSSAATSCVNGFCAFNFCNRTPADGGAPGTFGGPCGASAPDAGDGTCVPSFDGLTYARFGICVPNGSATTTCNADTPDNPTGPIQGVSEAPTSRNPASEYCGSGSACAVSATGTACASFCDPGQGGCTGADFCVVQDPSNSTWGLCGACIQGGQPCVLNTDCCTGSCNGINGCAGGCNPNSPDGC